ncbi:MAG TPA: sporulation protein YunB [Oscillospiraceae bacterium]|nr:sporulation protein YunB [Oscillospiraceae bacterium]
MSRLRRRGNDKARRFGIKFIAIGMILIGLVYLIDSHVRPIITSISMYKCQVIATRIMNEAIFEELSKSENDYSNLVSLKTNSNGDIIAVESNMPAINLFKSELTQLMNEAIDDIDMHYISISLGTVTGIYLLYGKGPSYDFRLTPGGYVGSRVISSFVSTGINQSLHRINLEIVVDIAAIIPGYTTHTQVSTNYIMAETVIIGAVPGNYTHVITESKELVSDLNDYKAE